MMRWDERRNQKSWKCCGIYYTKSMETYCVSCKKNTASKNSCVKRTNHRTKNRLILVSNYAKFSKKMQVSLKIKSSIK